jgi:GH24 family phage-related lysozyme (muramidase)
MKGLISFLSFSLGFGTAFSSGILRTINATEEATLWLAVSLVLFITGSVALAMELYHK